LKNLVEIVVVMGGLGTEAGSRELARGQGLGWGNEDGWELDEKRLTRSKVML
jgi:hypothetical protein